MSDDDERGDAVARTFAAAVLHWSEQLRAMRITEDAFRANQTALLRVLPADAYEELRTRSRLVDAALRAAEKEATFIAAAKKLEEKLDINAKSGTRH